MKRREEDLTEALSMQHYFQVIAGKSCYGCITIVLVFGVSFNQPDKLQVTLAWLPTDVITFTKARESAVQATFKYWSLRSFKISKINYLIYVPPLLHNNGHRLTSLCTNHKGTFIITKPEGTLVNTERTEISNY